MKQLVVVVSPPAFYWNPYFDFDPCELVKFWPLDHKSVPLMWCTS